MTIRELISKLEKFDGDCEVFLYSREEEISFEVGRIWSPNQGETIEEQSLPRNEVYIEEVA